MVLFDLLQMTKTKIIVLVLLMVFFIPSYIDLSCIPNYCALGKEVCACGFLPLEFFVCFVWAYIFACLIIESAKLTRKFIKKN